MIGWLAPLFCRCGVFVFGPHDDHSARRWRNHPLQILEQRLLSFIHRPCKVVPKVVPNTRGMRVSRHIKMHANTPTTYPPGEWCLYGSCSIDGNTGHNGYFVWIACFFCSSASFFCAVSMSCAASRSSCTIVYWAMLNPRYTSASAFVHGLRSAALYNTRRLNKCHVSHRMQYLYACAAYRMHVRHVQHTICMALHSRALMRRPKMHGHTGSAVKSSARLENPDNTGNFATIATERFTAARKRCHHHHHGIRKTKICDTPRARAKNSRALI
jgi:hypothetical protein